MYVPSHNYITCTY